MHFLPRIAALTLLVSSLSVPDSFSAEESDAISFSKDIRPILSANCFKCHGPDDAKDDKGKSLRKAGLRLDVADGQDWKEIASRIVSTNLDEIMPPPEANKTLTSEEIDLLKRWINEGFGIRKTLGFFKTKKNRRSPLENIQSITSPKSLSQRKLMPTP